MDIYNKYSLLTGLYWVGLKVRLGFSVRRYGMNCMATPIIPVLGVYIEESKAVQHDVYISIIYDTEKLIQTSNSQRIVNKL